MKAGANYLYVPPTTKGSSQEHHDEISAYLSRHHSQKTNTPICLWHTKAVINMAHWSEYMYSRSIQCQLPPRWREEKMMFIMHQCGLEGMLFYQSEEQIVKMPVKAAEKKQKACFIQWATVTLDILTCFLRSGSKEQIWGNITSLSVGTCLCQNPHWLPAFGFYLFTSSVYALWLHRITIQASHFPFDRCPAT